MHISIASDHGGFAMKERLKKHIAKRGFLVQDNGTYSEDSVDYPEFALRVARDVAEGNADRGVLVCGTGIGVSMVANKVDGIRAALCHDRQTAELSRQHNDANVLCLGGRVLGELASEEIVDVWLDTEFEGGRHTRRISQFPQGCSPEATAS